MYHNGDVVTNIVEVVPRSSMLIAILCNNYGNALHSDHGSIFHVLFEGGHRWIGFVTTDVLSQMHDRFRASHLSNTWATPGTYIHISKTSSPSRESLCSSDILDGSWVHICEISPIVKGDHLLVSNIGRQILTNCKSCSKMFVENNNEEYKRDQL